MGFFLRCTDFCWGLVMQVPEETCMSSRNVRETQGKEGSCLLLKTSSLQHTSKMSTSGTVLTWCMRKICHCVISSLRCHSGPSFFYLGKQTSFQTLQSISLLWLSPFRPKHPNFSTNYSYYKSPSGPTQAAVLGGVLKQNWKHSHQQRIYN